jgi:acylphosphatase
MTDMSFGAKPQRKHLLYTGRVQGVGFRFTFENIAGTLGITGYVRNLPNGNVEAVCQGPGEKIEMLIERVSERMGGYISSCRVKDEYATEEFEGFSIRT